MIQFIGIFWTMILIVGVLSICISNINITCSENFRDRVKELLNIIKYG